MAHIASVVRHTWLLNRLGRARLLPCQAVQPGHQPPDVGNLGSRELDAGARHGVVCFEGEGALAGGGGMVGGCDLGLRTQSARGSWWELSWRAHRFGEGLEQLQRPGLELEGVVGELHDGLWRGEAWGGEHRHPNGALS